MRNGLYNVSGQTVRGVVALLTIPVLVRFLGIHEYGVWSLAYAVVGLMMLGETGISAAATVFLSKDLDETGSDEASNTLAFILASGAFICLVLGVVLWFFAPALVGSLIAFSTADRIEAGRAVSIAGLAVAAFILQRVLIGVEQAFDRYGVISALDVAQSLLANGGLMAVAWMGGKSVAMMKWQAFAWGCFLVVHSCFVWRLAVGRKLALRWNGSKAKRIIRFSMAAWTSMLGSTAFNACDRLIVGALLGAPALGIYSAITNITSRINSFSGMAVQPLMPSLSRDSRKTPTVESRIREAAHLNVVIAVAAGIFLCVLADRVMSVMVPGSNTSEGVLGLQIATLVYALYSINAPGYYILFSVGQEWKNATITLFSGTISLGLIFVGARYFGLLGALAGNAGYIFTLLMIWLGSREIGIEFRKYATWVALPLLALMAGFSFGFAIRGFLWWRLAIVSLEAVLLLVWFSHEQNGFARLRGAWGRLAQS